MSRSQERKCCYNRWSDPILRRRYSMQLVPTSEDESSSVRRSRSSSPFVKSLHQKVNRLDETTNGCCSCHIGHCDKKKTWKNRSKLLKQQKSSESQQMRESLEIQLVGSQVEEAFAEDKQIALIHHLELSTNALEAVIQHVNSLQISFISAQRIIHFSRQLMFPSSSTIVNYNRRSSLSMSDLDTRIRQAESCKENRLRLLNEVIENCSKNIIMSKQLQSLIDEHEMKKKDFTIAARNFQNLLENSKLSISQMDKLQLQYQAIMDDYKRNRTILDSELPKIIKTRLGTIRKGFSMIAIFYQDLEYSKQISDLFKVLSENIFTEESETDNNDHVIDNHNRHNDADDDDEDRHHHHHQHHRMNEYEKSEFIVKEEICQKCKINKVENK